MRRKGSHGVARVRADVELIKYQGKQKVAEFQAYVASKNLPFKVSVVTGPSGSTVVELLPVCLLVINSLVGVE